MSIKFSSSLKKWMYERQEGKCYYCHCELLPLETPWPRAHRRTGEAPIPANIAVIDHIMPLARGGDSAKENLCYACFRCNELKSDYTAGEFRCVLEGVPVQRPRLNVERRKQLASERDAAARERRLLIMRIRTGQLKR